jgi:hypothetical protein
MALEWKTLDDILQIEDNLQAALSGLRELRQIFKEKDAQQMRLNVSTAEGHAKWLKQWALMEPGRTRARMDAEADQNLVREEKKRK